jgi:long-subunit acyl-CoA synthetase (AMP-forming)
MAIVAGMHYALKSSLFKDDTYLSYLPLYIRLEYNLVNALFVSGVTIGFGTDIDTYLLSAPYNSNVCPVSYGDIQSFRPSILFGIRPWWDMIHGKVLQVVADRPAIEQKEFWYYLEKKREVVAGTFPRLASLSYLFEKWGHIQEIRNGFFGERIRWIGVTCSMMTAEKRELLGLVFGGPKGIMVEGWPLPHLNA